MSKLKPFRFTKGKRYWVALDPSTGYASQGTTRSAARKNLVEALRLVILTYQDDMSRRAGEKKA